MLNTNKFLEFFDPSEVKQPINIIGCGAIGSHICEELARLGFEEVNIYDFDKVESHNIANQMFEFAQIGMEKVIACADIMKRINPSIKVNTFAKGLQSPYVVNGIIIMCVDDIDLRRAIIEANKFNPNMKAILDFRMRLTDAQHYFAVNNQDSIKALLDTMDFTHDEAKQATPVSACGVELSVAYNVKAVTAYGTANLINYLLNGEFKKMVLVNTSRLMAVDAL